MRKEKFQVTMYATNRAELEKALVAKGIFADEIISNTQLRNNEKKRALIRSAGQILSGDTDEDIEVMIKILRKALKTQPKQTADYIDGITMWQNVEYSFTVEAACEYIGIK
ncbi:MAG TPA: hypothetical protein VMX17_00970 [Candidatus Glassbacteria bacterium]|nr:hypothetical protein [Candidatus Glassbacteria bacterium]